MEEYKMSKSVKAFYSLALSALMAMSATSAARADAYVDMAKDYVAKATAPAAAWDGPTTGPKAVEGKKVVVFVSADQRNGGLLGVSKGVEEAATILGWDLRVIDGQGSVSGRASALTQAIASKPDAIILGSVDAIEQASMIEEANAAGIKIVSWHSGSTPGKIEGSPIITNVTTDPQEVAKAAGLYAVADSEGTANVILFTDSIYAIATAKTDATMAAVKGCGGCSVLEVVDTPLGDVTARMPQLTTSLLSKYGEKWTYSIGVNDLYYDFMAPSLEAAGIAGTGNPRNVSSGDGSEAAFNRIRGNSYQTATVAEPLFLHGWILIDEVNRALSGEAPSGYSTPVHLFTPANVDSDGGKEGVYDPANGYREAYRAIWGK
jgi:ribose transport system substrate-binding protein